MNKHEKARKIINQLGNYESLNPSMEKERLLFYSNQCEATERELETLKQNITKIYAKMSMYIGNDIMIENEEFDVTYFCELLEELNKVGKEE